MSTTPGQGTLAVPERADAPVDVAAVRVLARLARLLERATGDLGASQYRVLAANASNAKERDGLLAVSELLEHLARTASDRTEAHDPSNAGLP